MPSAGPFAFVSNNKNNSFPTTGPSSSVGESMLPLLSSIAAGMMPPPFGLNFLANSGMGKPPLNGQQQQQIQLLEALFKANILPPAPQEALKQVGIGEHLNNALTGVNRNRMANGIHQHSKADDNDDIPSSIQQQQQPYQQRKRRRMIGNLDNTLDGLVAKKADQMPLKKRYQTETEAIELPDDEVEIKRMEADPDVCTRMCSVCGYQGKWVSEMIRHKRVHTTERPFKCKYCNRTSKWKADLIRHVAKTHGIRVVSKYSRSKAFEMGKKDSNSGESEETGASMSMDDGEEDMMMADDDMVILDSSSSGSSDYGSAISWHQQDENNNDIEDGHHQIQTAQKVVNEVAAKGENGGAEGESINSTVGIGHSDHLNSQYRKAQRLLNSIIGQRFSGQQQQQQIHSTTKVQPQQQQLQSAAAAAAPSLLNLFALSNNFPPNLDSLNLAAQILLDQQQPKPAKPQPQQQQQKQNEYKCDFCPFEQISFPMLVSHLHAVHGIAPFICLNCHCSFNELVSAAEHFAQCSCPMTSLKSNFVLKNAIAEEEPQTRQHIGSTVPNGFINEHFSATLGQLSMLLSKPVASSVGGLFPSLAKCPPNNSQFATNAPVGNGENGCGSSPSSMLSTAASYSSLNSVEKHMHSNSNEMDPIEDHKTNGNGKQGGEKAKSPTVQAVGVFNKKMEEEEGHGSSSEIEVDEQKKMNKAHSGALDKMNIHHHREQFGGYSATDSAFIPLGGNSSSSSPIGININHKNNQRGWFPPCLNPGVPAAVTSLETFSKFLAELHKQTFAAQHSSMPTANGSSI